MPRKETPTLAAQCIATELATNKNLTDDQRFRLCMLLGKMEHKKRLKNLQKQIGKIKMGRGPGRPPKNAPKPGPQLAKFLAATVKTDGQEMDSKSSETSGSADDGGEASRDQQES